MADDEMKDTPRPQPDRRPSGGMVKVKITKFGAGKVSTGEHVAEVGDVMFKAGEICEVQMSIAKDIEKKGYGEIQ